VEGGGFNGGGEHGECRGKQKVKLFGGRVMS